MIKTKKKTAFELKCEAAAALIGEEPYFVEDGPGSPDDAFERNGYLDIRRRGVRCVFNTSNNYDLPASEHNRKVRIVMEAMGMAKKIDDRVLLDETEEDDDKACPNCGKDW